MLSARPDQPNRAGIYGAAVLLVVMALAAWANSFHGPFVLDDLPAIDENATIRQLSTALSPPGDGQTVSGRPLVNLSFALNWAAGGVDVRGYHLVNLAIHGLAALVMFGVARRTLRSATLAAKFGRDATPLALALAALWMLHPLQTESVTYLSQRAESLAGLWLLLTLYASLRGAGSESPTRWHALAFVTCLLGMATKEIMYAAPLLVLLHDRTFDAGTFRAAVRRRPWFYVALGATWLVLAWLVRQTGNRGATAGFGLGISPWHYLLTQCEALPHYLRLALWPSPLVLDYGTGTVSSLGAVWLRGLLLVALLGATLVALVRRSTVGFLGAWFFLLLAPSSSILPIATQTIAEHRMYLPLAAVVALFALILWSALGRRSCWILLGVATALAAVTAARNTDYRSAIHLWEDTATKRPDNARAFGELANTLLRAGRVQESLAAYERALQLMPDYPKSRQNYAGALADVGRLDEAAAQFELAIRQLPNLADPVYGLGNVRRAQGRTADALACYETALRLRPDFALAHNNLANLLSADGRTAEALAHYAAAARAAPNLPDAEYNWANTLARAGRLAEARPHYEAALRLAPNFASAHENLGVTLASLGLTADAIRELEAAQRLDPKSESIRHNLAAVRQGR